MALTPPFATVDDVESRWRALSTTEAARATTLLTDASQQILDEDTRGLLSALTTPTSTIIRITCAMVIRAMASGVEESAPVTQDSWGSGPFNQQRTYANPLGDLYLTKAERRSLKFSRMRAGGSDMWAGAYEEEA